MTPPTNRAPTESVLAVPQLREELSLPFPKTRADCKDGPRPCPHVSCRHHIMQPVKVGNPLDPDLWTDQTMTCALDVVEQQGPLELSKIGVLLGVSKQRCEQLEARALTKLRMTAPYLIELLELHERERKDLHYDPSVGHRRTGASSVRNHIPASETHTSLGYLRSEKISLAAAWPKMVRRLQEIKRGLDARARVLTPAQAQELTASLPTPQPPTESEQHYAPTHPRNPQTCDH